MSHDLLDDLQVRLVLTEPGAECVPEDVRRKVREQHRLTLFPGGSDFLHAVIVTAYPFNGPVDDMGVQHETETVAKNEPPNNRLSRSGSARHAPSATAAPPGAPSAPRSA